MKHIVRNSYLQGFRFSSLEEASFFLNKQGAKRSLFVEDSFGENYYCYVCSHSLTREKQFVLCFSSDEEERNLNVLFWNNLLVLDTGKNIYLINETLEINASFEISTPLIGLYLINDKRLLLLEEASMRIIGSNGQILKSDIFDLIEDFSINGSALSIQTNDENRIIELIE